MTARCLQRKPTTVPPFTAATGWTASPMSVSPGYTAAAPTGVRPGPGWLGGGLNIPLRCESPMSGICSLQGRCATGREAGQLPLPEDKLQSVIKALRERGALPSLCSACHRSAAYSLEPFYSALPALDNPLGGFPIQIPRFWPIARVHCNNCGHIELFDLTVLGLGDWFQQEGAASS